MEARVSEANAAGTRIPQPARRDASAAAAESEACIAAKHPAAGPMEQRSPSRWVRGREVSTMAAARRHADPAAAPGRPRREDAAQRRALTPAERGVPRDDRHPVVGQERALLGGEPGPEREGGPGALSGRGRPAEDRGRPAREAFPSARARRGGGRPGSGGGDDDDA